MNNLEILSNESPNNILSQSFINVLKYLFDNKKDIKLIKQLYDIFTNINNNSQIMNINMMNFIEEIGDGAFGVVYKAFNKIDNQYYAIKKIDIEQNSVINEVRILSQLEHDNIIRYYSAWIDFNNEKEDFALYIQMELCDNSLSDYLETRNNKLCFLNSEEYVKSMNIFYELLNVIIYIHDNGLVHRDLKPSNILFKKNKIKLCDFGLVNNLQITYESEKYIGTCLYADPKQYCQGIIDKQCDIYSLGIIFFELLCVFKTGMERIKMIENLKNGKLSDNFINMYPKESKIILKMINSEINLQQIKTDLYDNFFYQKKV